MTPILLLDFLSRKTHSDIYKFVKHRPFVSKINENSNLITLEKHTFLLELHQQLVKVVEPIVNAPILASKSSLHIFDGKGSWPSPSDEEGVSLHYIVYQDAAWPLIIDGKEYLLQNNHGIIFDTKDEVKFATDHNSSILWCLSFRFSFQRL